MKLIFVYNANAGIAAGILDSLHKIVSPATYECSLCAVTHGALRMDPTWRAWLKAQPFETVFFHRPDFRKAHPAIPVDLPAILIDRSDGAKLLMTAEEIAGAAGVSGLIEAIQVRLAQTN